MTAIYEMIIKHINDEIGCGRMKAGKKVPSVKEMSVLFKCSKASVLKAYDELQKKHILYSKPKSGYYIVKDTNTGNNENNKKVYDYMTGNLENNILPYQEFYTCMNKAFEVYREQLFGYCSVQGFEPLRFSLVDHLKRHQIFTHTDRIFITSGSQQALNILINMSFNNCKCNVLVEQPTYLFMLDALNLFKVPVTGIERNFSALDLDRLEYIFKTGNIKFFYTMPRFHHPTGSSLSSKQKRQIAYLAEKYDVYIIEDDQMADLDLDSRADPLFSYDLSSHTIYIKSFSKTLLPGIRLAAVVLPDSLSQNFKKSKYLNDIYTSPFLQAALEIFIKSGMHDIHIDKIKQFYSDKMSHFKAIWSNLNIFAVKENMPDTGFYLWFELPESINGDYVKHNLQSQGIYIGSGTRYYLEEYRKTNYIKLSLNNISKEDVENSLPLVADEINKLLKYKNEVVFI